MTPMDVPHPIDADEEGSRSREELVALQSERFARTDRNRGGKVGASAWMGGWPHGSTTTVTPTPGNRSIPVSASIACSSEMVRPTSRWGASRPAAIIASIAS